MVRRASSALGAGAQASTVTAARRARPGQEGERKGPGEAAQRASQQHVPAPPSASLCDAGAGGPWRAAR